MQQIAVAVYPDHGHIGLLHREEVAAPLQSNIGKLSIIKLLHFAWHERWECTTDTADVAFWINPDVEIEQAELIAGYCRLIPLRNAAQKIAFGFGRPDLFFNDNWQVSDEAAKTGITCAAFVLAVFHRAGARLLNYDEWKAREEDKPKLIEILNGLRRTAGVSVEHIRCHEAGVETGQVRFRPLEVAGAAWSKDRPIGLAAAERIAGELAEEFRRISDTLLKN